MRPSLQLEARLPDGLQVQCEARQFRLAGEAIGSFQYLHLRARNGICTPGAAGPAGRSSSPPAHRWRCTLPSCDAPLLGCRTRSAVQSRSRAVWPEPLPLFLRQFRQTVLENPRSIRGAYRAVGQSKSRVRVEGYASAVSPGPNRQVGGEVGVLVSVTGWVGGQISSSPLAFFSRRRVSFSELTPGAHRR